MSSHPERLRRLQEEGGGCNRLRKAAFLRDQNAKNVVGDKQEKGTRRGYSYASIDIVEVGRRLTLYTLTANQFTEKAEAVEKLIKEAEARSVHTGVVLLDRAFFTVDVIKKLKLLGVQLIMPAVKNEKVKEAMLNYDGQHPAQRFILGEGRQKRKLHLQAPSRGAAEKEADRFRPLFSASQQTSPRLQPHICQSLSLRITSEGGV